MHSCAVSFLKKIISVEICIKMLVFIPMNTFLNVFYPKHHPISMFMKCTRTLFLYAKVVHVGSLALDASSDPSGDLFFFHVTENNSDLSYRSHNHDFKKTGS